MNQAANKSFDIKKQYYRQSEIKLTQELYGIDKWTPESIKKRQEKLADIAVEVWNLRLD